MSGLSTLKLVSRKPSNKASLHEVRRQKLCKKLCEQLELAKRMKDGGTLEATITKRIRDPETGETKLVEQAKRIKPWWWTAEDGTTCLTVRYGAKALELAKDRNAIEADGLDGVISGLEVIRTAVECGELDAQIDGLFKKDKPVGAQGRATLSLRKSS